jgi:hypothetical protein
VIGSWGEVDVIKISDDKIYLIRFFSKHYAIIGTFK